MLETQKKTINIHEYYQIVSRRRYFLIIPLLLCLIIGIIICLISKPVYESSTVIQVSSDQELSKAMGRLVPGITPQQRINNLRRLMTSHTYLKRLIEILNLYNDPKMQGVVEENKDKFPDLTIEEISELFWIDYLREHIAIGQAGDFIQIGATGSSPDFVYDLVKTLTQVFIDESLRLEVGGIRGALEFSSEQLAIYKQKLDESEERLRKFRENLVQDELEDQAIISTNMDKINSMLTATDLELREANNRLASFEYQISQFNIDYDTPNNYIINTLKAQLLDAILELSKLMLDYSWQDVRILKINSSIEDLREKIRNEIEKEIKSKNPVIDGSRLDIIVQKEIIRIETDFLKRKRDTLSNLSNVYKANAAKGPSKEITLSRLQRDLDANREIYQTLLRQTRGSEIEEALQKTAAEFKFKIIEPPMKPIKAVSPKPVRIMLLSVLIGAIIGIGIISLLEISDHSFKNVDNVEKLLNLPVLGTMPYIEMQVSNKNFGKSGL